MFKILNLCFVPLAEKRHGQQEDRDLLHGGEEERWQRGEESKIQKKHKHAQTGSFLMVPKGVPEKILSMENPLCQGVVTLGTVMYRIDLGILFQILFALYACVCVCLCVWAPYLHRAHVAECERQRPSERHSGACVCVCVCVCEREICIFKA